MPTYRFYVLSSHGRRNAPLDCLCDDDDQAVSTAAEMRPRDGQVEVWLGVRLVQGTPPGPEAGGSWLVAALAPRITASRPRSSAARADEG